LPVINREKGSRIFAFSDISTFMLNLRPFIFLGIFTLLIGCGGKPPEKKPLPVEVKIIDIKPVDASVSYEFVGQAESSRQVEIRARVDGFLDKVAYEEGAMVEPGQVMFKLDRRPFLAALQQAEGELALQTARLFIASSNLKRIRPLAEKDAVSKKDLDDAIGQEKAAEAAVLAAKGSVREAELNLSYTTILSPLKGLASKTSKQEGAYIPPGEGSLLTYVAQLDPIWILFNLSENQILQYEQQVEKGLVLPPPDDNFGVEVILADGTSFPHKGKINFAEPNIDPKTGTLLLRAAIKNPKGKMRPGQFVRVYLHGAKRPNAILVPQKSVQQGAKGHFVWVLGKDDRPKVRSVIVGPWQGDNWFIEEGLKEGDVVITDGIAKLNPEIPVKVIK